jgi:NADPH-dependent glutamate synthase beta subunit-like oxidoreductase/NAD-dependent dihydropyrimidine dehydrogenase PreA subunit
MTSFSLAKKVNAVFTMSLQIPVRAEGIEQDSSPESLMGIIGRNAFCNLSNTKEVGMALRKKIVDLVKMVGGLPGRVFKIDETSPEYYCLECVVSDEQAEVALAMGLRIKRTPEEVARLCGKPLELTRKILYELAEIGVCTIYVHDGVDSFRVPIFAPGIMEVMVNKREQLAKYPQIGKAFEEYPRIRMGTLAPNLPMGQSIMRVIPVETAINSNPKKVSLELISHYLDNVNSFAVADCSCRASRRVLSQGCGHLEYEMCIVLGQSADYYVRTGRARKISRDEALDILRKAEENGLVHQITNTDGGEIHGICNCCACSCFGLRVSGLYEAYDANGSNYKAQVDKEKCVACGQCVENCPTNALKLGQKICPKTSLPEAPEGPKITNHVWTEKMWNHDWRTTRKNVVETGTSPCKTNCPANIAVQGYIRLAALGQYREALELIKKENPFPAVCGRICPRKCESECTRGDIDSPLAVDEVKKFLADQELKAEYRFVPQKRYNFGFGESVAVIGAGPAGLACAYYLAIDGLKVTVFEKHDRLGGMLTLGIPSYRLEKSVLEAEIDVLKQLGVKFNTGVEVGSDIKLDDLRKQGYKAFYLAIGAQGGRKLGITGENTEGVIAGVDFLRDVNLGREIKLGGSVVVIGGGNVAIDVARTTVRSSAGKVNLFCLESRNQMPALEEEILDAEAEGIVINNSWGPVRIVTEEGKIKGVEFKKCTSVFDKDDKFSPQFDESQTMIVDANFVLLSVGQSIEWGGLLEGSKVRLGRGNTALADSFTYQSDEPDVFVGGDAFTGPKFAIDAIAAGKQGAVSIQRFVQPGQSLVFGRDRREYKMFDKDNLIIGGYDSTPRQQVGHTLDKFKTFKDPRVTFSEEQVKAETARCLGCGSVQIEEYCCIGCGQCTTKCKFDAISLKKVSNEFGGVFEKLPLKVVPYATIRAGKIAVKAVKDVFLK